MALACTFVFCALVAAQCLLLLMFGRRAAQAASVTFQVLFAVGLVQLLFFLPRSAGRCGRRRQPRGVGLLSALPPTWFFGLYEQLADSADARAVLRARLAVRRRRASGAAGGGPLRVQLLRRLSQRALEGVTPQRPPASAARARLAARRAVAASTGRCAAAVRRFTVRTLVRSRTHRMMLAVYGGLRARPRHLVRAISIALRNGGEGLWRPGSP